LGGCLQQEYEGEQNSEAHRNDSCGMPTVVTFDDHRSRGHSQCFGFHVLLPLRVGTAGLGPLPSIPISVPIKPSDVAGA